MNIVLRSINDKAILQDSLDELEETADKITRAANYNTTAPAGFTWERKEDHILLGPTGAAGLPVEVGTFQFPARRPFKAALDANKHR